MPIGPAFLDELKAKEQATGLTLLKPGVSWTDRGLDPLPEDVPDTERAAIEEVVAAHDANKAAPKPEREKDREQFDAALAQVQAGPVKDALVTIRKLLG